MNDRQLAGRTILMSGGSRGIGLAIGIAAARLGANIVLLAKTDTPDPRLPGTIHTAAAEIEAAGGKALAVVGDVRKEESVQTAVDRAVETFVGIDIVVNNASAIDLQGTEAVSIKKFDLMLGIEHRGTFLLARAALPHLQKSEHPHILTLSPPLNLSPRWLGAHPPYTLAKYGMTLLALGWAEEYRGKVASNCLWPETVIATAASRMIAGDAVDAIARTPEIMADAAISILTDNTPANTGNTYIDSHRLAAQGITDLSQYGPTGELPFDLFVDGPGE